MVKIQFGVKMLRHFLADLSDETYDGFPTLGIEYHNTENLALRQYHKAADVEGGVLITNVLPYSSAETTLQRGDILIAINDIPVSMDGTFEFRDHERLGLSYLINNQQMKKELLKSELK